MNLTTDPWIPVITSEGVPQRVSLNEAFERGENLRDLAVRPHERIALMRLLICIAQAGLDGPADDRDLNDCRTRMATSVLAYLQQWRDRFDLFGPGPRFLQVDLSKRAGKGAKAIKEGDVSEGTALSKLDLALATGNNTTLFDNAGGSPRAFPAYDLALMLLSYQCFSPCGKIGVAVWNGQESSGKGTSEYGPCIAGSMIHTLIRGETLLDSIHRNILTKRQATDLFGKGRWGKPIWEQMPAGPHDAGAEQNATLTYLGRLVPLSRTVRIAEDRCTLVLANGLSYPSFPSWREPSSTVVVREGKNGQPERHLLRASIEKAIWRQLHAVTIKRVSEKGNGGPVALENMNEDQPLDLWVGGVVPEKLKPAKIADMVESVFHVPAAMLDTPGQNAYERGVKQAEDIAFRLMRSVSVYHAEMGDKLDRPEVRNRRQQIQGSASTRFWTAVENSVDLLLRQVANLATDGADEGGHGSTWGTAVWRAALAAYEQACPRATPRQVRAYAVGRGVLIGTNRAQQEPGTEREVDG